MKLTPLELSQPPIKIIMEDYPYDLFTQKRVGLTPSMAHTYGGTQTFNSQGKPIDKDND